MEYGNAYYQWPAAGWWDGKETQAKKMTMEALHFAIHDCFEAGQAMPVNQPKYTDESSIYRRELERRSRKAAR